MTIILILCHVYVDIILEHEDKLLEIYQIVLEVVNKIIDVVQEEENNLRRASLKMYKQCYKMNNIVMMI